MAIPKTLFCKNDRIEIANKALSVFARGTTMRIDSRGCVVVEWIGHGGENISRRWMTRGQDFYPVWHRHWGHGGTATMALSQLVRWVRGCPVLGISSWRYWGSPKLRLFRTEEHTHRIVTMLLASGYPENVPCVLCGDTEHIGDWWSLKGMSGPCCGMNSGCQRRGIGT